jgi:hypothetical protein
MPKEGKIKFQSQKRLNSKDQNQNAKGKGN